MTLQIPTVTIADLQAFQAKHFPGHENPLTFDYTSGWNNVDEEAVDDNDDLGYYPDGVKRTLTDEQIEIFRHNEIHSLLREKRLREEALAESRGEHEGEDVDVDVYMEGKRKTTQTAPRKEMASNQELDHSSRPGGAASRGNSTNSVPGNHKSGALDYGEDESVGDSPKDSPLHAHVMGRRIVSYDD